MTRVRVVIGYLMPITTTDTKRAFATPLFEAERPSVFK